MTREQILKQICGGDVPPNVLDEVVKEVAALSALWFNQKSGDRRPGTLAAEWSGYSVSAPGGRVRFRFYFAHTVQDPSRLHEIVDRFPFEHEEIEGLRFKACSGRKRRGAVPAPASAQAENVSPGMRINASPANGGNIYGTLGAFLIDGSHRIWILSANHVLGFNNKNTLQTLEFNENAVSHAVQQVCFVSLKLNAPNAADAAIALLPGNDHSVIADPGFLTKVQTQPANTISNNTPVTRISAGKNPHKTTVGTEVELAPELEYDLDNCCGVPNATFSDQYLVNGANFSEDGDSGSMVVFNNDSNVLGMVVADSETVKGHPQNSTAVTPFDNLLDALNSQLSLNLSLFQGPPKVL
jgi:hypothetical protein